MYARASGHSTGVLILGPLVLVQSHAAVSGFPEHVHGIDEADLPRCVGHGQGVGPAAIAEEAHAVQQSPIGDASSGEDDLIAGRQVAGRVHAFGIADTHAFHALFEFLGVDLQPGHHFA